jgi:hypothetical protein
MIQPIAKAPSGRTHDQQRIDAELAGARVWVLIKRAIALRDGYACRLCRRPCRFDAPQISRRADPHHIVFRSAGGEDTLENMLQLCRWCHDDVHVFRDVVLSGNANEQDELGRYRCVKVERLIESGWQVEGLV